MAKRSGVRRGNEYVLGILLLVDDVKRCLKAYERNLTLKLNCVTVPPVQLRNL